ncbi:MAG: hypothetical protein ABR505_12255 [Actinomycetota bacterium]
MTRPRSEFEIVKALIAAGLNDCQIARLSGVPRRTVLDWRWGRGQATPRYEKRPGSYECTREHDFAGLSPDAYSYLLGMYLGDGCLSALPRGVFKLRIFCDAQYLGIIEECSRAIEAVMPGQRASRQKRKSRCVEILMYSKHWPCLFPQHGPGRKHERPIHLEPWQLEIVNRSTEMFLRGLIHSDGCRVVANDRGVRSVRYHFSNLSEDIKALFCAALDRLDIHWTRNSSRSVAIYRKADVARLDEFIGPKY